jgi:large subunit ribosomal protein L24e
MAEQRVCSFCGLPLEPGTGTMYVKKDGSVFYFDRRKCRQSYHFGRLARKLKWTRHFPRGGAQAARAALEAQAVAAEVAKAEAGTGAIKKKLKEGPKIKEA